VKLVAVNMDHATPTASSRREFLSRLGGGLGGAALAQLLGADRLLAEHSKIGNQRSSFSLPHHAPRAKRVIQLFMNGGASQMDLFDYRPALFKRAGESFDPGNGDRVEAPTSEPGKVLRPPFEFRQHGQSGRWVSSLLPNLAACVDDLAFLMAMQSRTNVHGPGSYLMNTGFLLPGFPCFGAWISYALGSECDNLPAFVVLPDTKGLPYNQRGNFSSGFLPVTHQGTVIQSRLGSGTGAPPVSSPAGASPVESSSFIFNDLSAPASARLHHGGSRPRRARAVAEAEPPASRRESRRLAP
jgi:hypothetical protein